MAKPREPKQYVGVDSVKGSKTKPVLLGLAGLIVIAVVAGLLSSKPWESEEAATEGPEAIEYQPVTVTGGALPPQYFESDKLNEAVGSQAPDLHGKTFTGEPVDVTADGKPKVIVFVAHWCPHCQAEVPRLSEWIKANKDKYDVEYLAVSTASTPTRTNYPASAWLQKEKWPTPVMADDNKGTAAAAYGLGSYPYMVFLDGKNKIVTRTSGELSTSDFEQLVARAAATNLPAK